MPILKGAMGYTRFLIKEYNDLSPELIAEKLNLFKFRDLHPHGEDNESIGWCSYRSEYDNERVIHIKDFLYDEKILLSMRIDTISLPKDLLKALVKKSIAHYMRDNNQVPSKTVRKEIEMAEIRALRARLLPKTKIFEAVWAKDELRVLSRSSSVVDRFVELFLQTFLMRPERRDFAYEACRLAHSPAVLETLTHQPIFVPALRVDVQ